MPFLLYLVLAAASPEVTTVPLKPAPGASAVTAIVVAGNDIRLDDKGRGRIRRDAVPASAGLRFYRTSPDARSGEQVFYYASDGTLATWLLHGAAAAGAAEVVVKAHADPGWESASTYEAPLEPSTDGRRLRFALSSGAWDVAVLVPGNAPAFALEVHAIGGSLALEPTTLVPAGRVKARILDARSGKPPDRWEAYVARVGADPETEEARFFEKRPISGGATALDFASLPVGGWELKIASPGRSEPRKSASIPTAGALADLGDVYVTDFGKLRVELVFPDEIPLGSFEIKLSQSQFQFGHPEIELGSRTVTPKADTVVEFAAVEPGNVEIECINAELHSLRSARAVIEPNRIAEARIVMHPVTLHGRVRHGEETVAGAAVSSPPGRMALGEPKAVMSDELGVYELRVWGGEDTLVLSTLPPDQTTSFVEFVSVDPESVDFEHDVLLPAAEIRGVVRDAETGAVLEGATVDFSTALADKEPSDDSTSFEREMTTDRDGRFRLSGLTADQVDVGVSHEGYAPAQFPSVRPTPEGTDLDVRLEKGVRLSGSVIDEAGVPVPGATVGLDVVPQDGIFARTATTSAEGHYEFTGVGTGTHTLGLIHCAHTIVLRSFNLDPPATNDSRGHTEDIQLSPEASPITARFEKPDGSYAPRGWFRWTINGLALPMNAWYDTLRGCGYPDMVDDDKIVLHGFPSGIITALSAWSQTVYGTLANDGSQTAWTIHLPNEKHLQGEQRAGK